MTWSIAPLIPAFMVSDSIWIDVERLFYLFLAAIAVTLLLARTRRDWHTPDRRPALIALAASILLDLVDELQQVGRPFVVYRLPVRYGVVILTLIYVTRRTRDDAKLRAEHER